MRLNKTETWILELLHVFAAAIVLLNVAEYKSGISLLFMVSVVLVLCLALLLWLKKFTLFDCVCVLALMLAFICVCVSTFSENVHLGFDYFKKFLLFAASIVYLRLVSSIKVSSGFAVFFERLTILLSASLIVIYILNPRELYVYTNFGVAYLYFNFDNPNFAAMYFLTLTMLHFIQVTKKGSWFIRGIHLLLACAMTFFCFETRSRNVQIIIVLFLVVWAFTTFRKNLQLRMTRAASFAVAIWPLVFCFAYMVLVNLPTIGDLFSFLVEEGKNLDSRSAIWSKGLQTVAEAPLFGKYNIAMQRQFHNSHLDVWGSYGIVTLIYVVYFLYKTIYNGGKCYLQKQNYLCMIGFCCCIIMGMAEAALFAGSQALFIFVGAFLLMSNEEQTD